MAFGQANCCLLFSHTASSLFSDAKRSFEVFSDDGQIPQHLRVVSDYCLWTLSEQMYISSQLHDDKAVAFSFEVLCAVY